MKKTLGLSLPPYFTYAPGDIVNLKSPVGRSSFVINSTKLETLSSKDMKIGPYLYCEVKWYDSPYPSIQKMEEGIKAIIVYGTQMFIGSTHNVAKMQLLNCLARTGRI